ncbi:MAG: hypothetical protein ACXWLH_00100 [Candidatus Saccharimonadales bacterium]
MPAASNTSLYNQLINITQVYLGPAAERFINRQVENHLNKKPKDISPDDLAKLIDWIQISISMLTEDSEIIEEYIGELNKLSGRNGKEKK